MELNEEDASPLEIVVKTNINEYFDVVIGHIEDIVLCLEFETLQNNFLEAHWQHFDYAEENKLEYMDFFQEYTRIFEQFFINELHKRMHNFDMELFVQELERDDAIFQDTQRGEIFELLHSLSDFQTFKELMLDYRRRKEGKMQHMDLDILITQPLFNANQSHTNILDS